MDEKRGGGHGLVLLESQRVARREARPPDVAPGCVPADAADEAGSVTLQQQGTTRLTGDSTRMTLAAALRRDEGVGIKGRASAHFSPEEGMSSTLWTTLDDQLSIVRDLLNQIGEHARLRARHTAQRARALGAVGDAYAAEAELATALITRGILTSEKLANLLEEALINCHSTCCLESNISERLGDICRRQG